MWAQCLQFSETQTHEKTWVATCIVIQENTNISKESIYVRRRKVGS